MARWADYYCEDCDIVFTFEKAAIHHEFPIKPPCPKCKAKNTRRKWGSVHTQVKRGKAGNSKDGYTGEQSYDSYEKNAKNTLKKIKKYDKPNVVGKPK